MVLFIVKLVNTFVTQTDSDMEFKVLARLRLIVEIRANLMDFLSGEFFVGTVDFLSTGLFVTVTN